MFLSSGLKQMRGQDRSVNLGSFVITLLPYSLALLLDLPSPSSTPDTRALASAIEPRLQPLCT